MDSGSDFVSQGGTKKGAFGKAGNPFVRPKNAGGGRQAAFSGGGTGEERRTLAANPPVVRGIIRRVNLEGCLLYTSGKPAL